MTQSEEPFYFLLPHTCLKLQARHTCADSHLSSCPSVEREKNDSLITSPVLLRSNSWLCCQWEAQKQHDKGPHKDETFISNTPHTPFLCVESHLLAPVTEHVLTGVNATGNQKPVNQRGVCSVSQIFTRDTVEVALSESIIMQEKAQHNDHFHIPYAAVFIFQT